MNREFCVDVGFEPRVVMQNDQADSIKELVKLGLGVSLLPLWSVSEDEVMTLPNWSSTATCTVGENAAPEVIVVG